MKTKKNDKFKIFKANTERYKNSSILKMQCALNEEERKQLRKK